MEHNQISSKGWKNGKDLRINKEGIDINIYIFGGGTQVSISMFPIQYCMSNWNSKKMQQLVMIPLF